MSVKQICETLFSFNPATKSVEVVDFLAKQGIEATECQIRAFKAWTKR